MIFSRAPPEPHLGGRGLYITEQSKEHEQTNDRRTARMTSVVFRSLSSTLVRFAMFLGASIKAIAPGGAPPLPPEMPAAKRRAEYRP